MTHGDGKFFCGGELTRYPFPIMHVFTPLTCFGNSSGIPSKIYLEGGGGGGEKLSVVQNFKDLLPFYTRKKLFITVKHPLEFIFMVGKEKYIFFIQAWLYL